MHGYAVSYMAFDALLIFNTFSKVSKFFPFFFARQKVLSKRSNAVKDTHYSCSLASKQVLDRQASFHTFCCRHLNKSGFFASAELGRLSALFFDFSGHVCRQLRFSKSSLTLYEVEASKSFFKGNF